MYEKEVKSDEKLIETEKDLNYKLEWWSWQYPESKGIMMKIRERA